MTSQAGQQSVMLHIRVSLAIEERLRALARRTGYRGEVGNSPGLSTLVRGWIERELTRAEARELRQAAKVRP